MITFYVTQEEGVFQSVGVGVRTSEKLTAKEQQWSENKNSERIGSRHSVAGQGISSRSWYTGSVRNL